MKAIIAVLFMLVAGFAHAEEIKIVNGEVMLVPANLVATGVKVTPEAAKYPDAVAEVFADRGKEVAVEKGTKHHVTGLFHYEMQTIQTVGVKYESASNTIVVVPEPKEVGIPKGYFFLFPVLWFAGIFMMVIPNVFAWRGNYNLRTLNGTASIMSVSMSSFVAANVGFTLAVSVAAIVLIIFSFLVNDSYKTVYVDDPASIRSFRIASIVYYIAMVVLAIAVYYPLVS